MKYYIIAGEASGDLHGSNLVRELKHLDASANIRGWGGDLMKSEGVALVRHYKDLAFMGFIEVIKNISAILNNLQLCKADIQLFCPDVLILIDYPGFNLRIARWANHRGFKIVYYISPQVWAWNESRVKMIRETVDKMLVILPFEKAFYETKWQYKVEYVGHPLVQVVDDFLKTNYTAESYSKPVVALLPGSRRQEISVKLPLMLQASKTFPEHHFVVAKSSSLNDDFYDNLLKDYPGVSSVTNQTYALLAGATAALVTSGTATLETALFGVPQVVCYKGSAFSYEIAKRLVRIKYISLVNLIMDKPVVKELIQHDLTIKNIVQELEFLLTDPDRVNKMKLDYSDLKNLLNEGGNASQKAAKIIFDFLKTTSSQRV